MNKRTAFIPLIAALGLSMAAASCQTESDIESPKTESASITSVSASTSDPTTTSVATAETTSLPSATAVVASTTATAPTTEPAQEAIATPPTAPPTAAKSETVAETSPAAQPELSYRDRINLPASTVWDDTRCEGKKGLWSQNYGSPTVCVSPDHGLTPSQQLSIGVHEAAHAWAVELLGFDTYTVGQHEAIANQVGIALLGVNGASLSPQATDYDASAEVAMIAPLILK